MTKRALSLEELGQLEQALIARGRHRDRLYLVLAASTGYRVSELLSLRIAQLFARDGSIATAITIERRELKGGRGARAKSVRSRRVPLSPAAREAIAAYVASLPELLLPDSPVFKSRQGESEPIARGQVHFILKSLARELGLEATRVGTHSLRKSFARAVHEAGGRDLIMTQRILGHSSPITTAKYLETTTAELDSVVLLAASAVSSAERAEPAVILRAG